MQEKDYLVVNYEDVNRNGDNDVIVLSVKSKQIPKSDGKGTFPSIKVLMYIRTLQSIGENGEPVYVFDKDTKVTYKDRGYMNRWIDLHFTTKAFKEGCYEGCILKDINDIKTGTLYVNANYIDKPNKWIVTPLVDEKGNQVYNKKGEPVMKYPEVWIKGGLIGFQKFKPTQSSFSYHPNNIKDVEVNEVTGEVTEDVNTETFTDDDVNE